MLVFFQLAKGNAQWYEKVHEFSQSLIQQIDTMSAIASTFSQFATMPTGQSERINVKEVVGRALELGIFDWRGVYWQ